MLNFNPPQHSSANSKQNPPDKSQLDLSVEQFYNSDSVSRQQPGRRDFVKVKTADGTETKIQKKVMIMTVMEAVCPPCKPC
jgi:hypothetical protein